MKKIFFLLGICLLTWQVFGQKLVTEMMFGKVILQTMESGEIILDGISLGIVKEGTRSTISEVVVGKHVLEFVFLNKDKSVYTFKINENETYVIEVKTSASVYKQDFKLGFILSRNGLDDNSINAATWAGIKKFTASNKMEQGRDYFIVQPRTEKDYPQGIADLIEEKVTTLIAPGYYLESQVLDAAERNKNVHFIVLDSNVQFPNVTSALFSDHEGAFIIGIISALICKRDGKDTVAFIGSIKHPIIERYLAGYSQGIRTIDPNMKILVKYSNTLQDVAKAGLLARELYTEGAYIIFHVSGESGKGIIEETISQNIAGNKCWVVGTGVDDYSKGIYINGSVVLTSMIKKYDLVVETLLQMKLGSSLELGKVYNFSLGQGALGIPDNNPNLDPEIVSVGLQYISKIAKKEIVVLEYLP